MGTKSSVMLIKSNTNSYIREVYTQYRTLETEKIHTSSPLAVANFIKSMIGDECRECFCVLGVNNRNYVVNFHKVSIGTNCEAIVHPREVFISAILSGCNGIIITHNHPSGVIEPSKQDIDTTTRLSGAGKIIGIPLMDHIIIGFDNFGYYSMKEHDYI